MNTTAIVTSIDIGIAAAVARTVPYYSSNRNRYGVIKTHAKRIHLELNWSYQIKINGNKSNDDSNRHAGFQKNNIQGSMFVPRRGLHKYEYTYGIN